MKGRNKVKSQQYSLKLAKRSFINDFYVLVFGLCCEKASVNIPFQLQYFIARMSGNRPFALLPFLAVLSFCMTCQKQPCLQVQTDQQQGKADSVFPQVLAF